MNTKINAQFIVDNAHPGEDTPFVYKLPKRATSGSAGYDFFANCNFEIPAHGSVLLDTGVKVKMEPGWFLMLVPRSGLGFKYRVSLWNTVGIIDSDYYSDEPHMGVIKAKLYNPSDSTVTIEKGKAYMQGIFVPFGIIQDDNVTTDRNGEGFGSTDKRN